MKRNATKSRTNSKNYVVKSGESADKDNAGGIGEKLLLQKRAQPQRRLRIQLQRGGSESGGNSVREPMGIMDLALPDADSMDPPSRSGFVSESVIVKCVDDLTRCDTDNSFMMEQEETTVPGESRTSSSPCSSSGLAKKSEERMQSGEDEEVGPSQEDSSGGFLPGKEYRPPKSFSFYLSEDEWNSIDPENTGTKLRKDQSRVLGPEWTNVFARYLEKRNTECILIANAGRCRRPDSRKRRTPYFTGSFCCKYPGCSVQYGVTIRGVPEQDQGIPVTVECEGSGFLDHSKLEELGVPVPQRPVRIPKPRLRCLRTSPAQRVEQMRIKEREKVVRKETVRRNKMIRASEYGMRHVPKVKRRPHVFKLSLSPQHSMEEEKDEIPGSSFPHPVRFNTRSAGKSGTGGSSRNWTDNLPTGNGSLDGGQLELQALQIKYYKMKMYKTELEIRQMDPNFDHSMLDEDGAYFPGPTVDERGSDFPDPYSHPHLEDDHPARFVTII